MPTSLALAPSAGGTWETRNKMKTNYSQERKDAIANLNKGKTLSDNVKAQIKPREIFLIKKISSPLVPRQGPGKIGAIKCFAVKDYKEQFVLKNKDTLFKGKNIILCNITGDILSEYTSIQQVSQVFSCNRKTVRKYLNNGKLFKNLGYLKLKTLKKQ